MYILMPADPPCSFLKHYILRRTIKDLHKILLWEMHDYLSKNLDVNLSFRNTRTVFFFFKKNNNLSSLENYDIM